MLPTTASSSPSFEVGLLTYYCCCAEFLHFPRISVPCLWDCMSLLWGVSFPCWLLVSRPNLWLFPWGIHIISYKYLVKLTSDTISADFALLFKNSLVDCCLTGGKERQENLKKYTFNLFNRNSVWWPELTLSAFRRQKQEGQELEASLGSIAKLSLSWARWDPISENKKNKINVYMTI